MSLRTAARRRPDPTTPAAPVRSQEQLRQRRRAGFPVAYTGSFSLADEIADICRPLAHRIAAIATPEDGRNVAWMFRVDLRDLVDAVHGELVSTVVGWLAEIEAVDRVQRDGSHLDSAGRKQAIQHLTDLAPRPAVPEIDGDLVRSGQWPNVLVDLARPYSEPLAELLSRALPPGHQDLRRAVSRSERLCDLLHEVDTAARRLELRIERAEQATQRRRTASLTPEQAKRAELRKLGIRIED